MPDLATTYLGLPLRSPLVASASPITRKLDNFPRLEEAGVGAIVMHSLFEEQITKESLELDYFLNLGTESFAESVTYHPNLPDYHMGPELYLDLIRQARAKVSIPIIASLNGVSNSGWVDYAAKMEAAGASALELNLYSLPADPRQTGAAVEEGYLQLVRAVSAQVKIPLAVKLSPFFSSIPNIMQRFAEAGAKGLVLFNRFYQPDFDLDKMEIVPVHTLSTSNDLRLPLRWIAILYGRVSADLALTSGVNAGADLVKALLAGASVGMSTSALLRNGIPYAGTILKEAEAWMTAHEYESAVQMRGAMSQKAVADPAAFERANYMRVLQSYSSLHAQ